MKTRFLAPLLVMCLGGAARAADATWNLNNDGVWATDANWNPASAPGATTGTTNPDTATFGTVINAARIITVDDNRNLAGINFAGNSSAYTLSGGSLILTSGGTLQTSGGGSGHTDTVSSPITLANADLDTKGSYSILSGSSTSGRLLVVSGSITGAATSGTTTLTLGGSNTGNNTISGVLADGLGGGNLAVEKTGSGTWILNNSNTFSGGLTIREGTLRLAAGTGGVGGSASPGTGTITLGDTTGTSTATLLVSNSFTVNRPLTVASGSSGVKTLTSGNVGGPGYNGAITLNDNLTVATISNVATNFSFAGSGNINLNANTLNLSLAPSGTSNAATVTISKPIVGTGGAVVIAGSGASTGTRTVALSGTNTYTGGTTVGGTGTNRALIVDVSGDQSAATGGWSIDINNETTSVATTVNFAAGSTVAVASGKNITLGGTSGHFGARMLNAAGTVTNDGTLLVRRSSTVNVTGDWTQNGAATLFTQGGGQAAMNVGTGGAFTYTSGTNFLLNTSTSDGAITSLNLTGGTFTTAAAIRNNTNALSANNSSFAQVTLNDGGTLKLSGNVAQLLTNNVGNIRMLLGETGSGGIIHTNGFNTAIDKTIGNIAGQAGKLTKQGLGTLTLSGTNTYTGSTTVENGVLALSGTGTIASSATISIAAGATLDVGAVTGGWTLATTQTLTGSGTISGAATIAGTHAPGTSPGTQTFDSGLAYSDTATLVWELNGNTDAGRGTNYDAVNVTGGTFALSSDAVIDLSFGAGVDFLDSFWSLDREWLVVDLSGGATAADSNPFTIGSITGGSNYSPALGTFGVLRQPGSNSADSVYLTWTAVPEPSMFALSILGLGSLCLIRRRSASSAADA